MRRSLLIVFALLIVATGFYKIVHGQSGPSTITATAYVSYGTNKLLRPTAVYISSHSPSMLFIADGGHNQVDVFQGSTLSVLAGNGTSGYIDGAPGSAEFKGITGISGLGELTQGGPNPSGGPYIPTTNFQLTIVDGLNNAIRQYCGYQAGYPSPAPRLCATNGVSTLAGGTAGYQDGSGTSAQFRNPGPIGSSYTLQGQLIPDLGNNAVRSLNTTGNTATTVISSTIPGYQDGPLANAQFRGVTSLTTVAGANARTLLTDSGNFVVRSIDANNNVSTFSGSGIQGYADGAPGSARFALPLSITFNPTDGYTYLADALNNCIRRIDSVGNVSTYAGQAGSPGLQDGSNSAAEFSHPSSITISNGFMYIADTNNNAIRRIDMTNNVVSTLLH